MAEIKLTKNELRQQQYRLTQLQKYLPTLQLKKAMLQSEVNEARLEIVRLEENFSKLHAALDEYSSLLTDHAAWDPNAAAKITSINRRHENIAGVEVPYFDSVTFANYYYNLFDAPPWVDSLIANMRTVAEAGAKVVVAKEKKVALEKELREVSIRVNLFEKILIPRSISNIKKIKVFLGDQQLAAVSQAKVAKTKIIERKMHEEAVNAV